MITYDRRLPLISDHIAKTGGTSFRRNLETGFGDRLFLHYADETAGTPPPRHRLTRRWRGGFRPDVCVHGHFNQHLGWGPADYYPEVVQFITWVREPVELQSSMFSFQLKQRGGAVYRRDGVEHVTQDIEEFFERSRCPFFRGFHPSKLGRLRVPAARVVRGGRERGDGVVALLREDGGKFARDGLAGLVRHRDGLAPRACRVPRDVVADDDEARELGRRVRRRERVVDVVVAGGRVDRRLQRHLVAARARHRVRAVLHEEGRVAAADPHRERAQHNPRRRD